MSSRGKKLFRFTMIKNLDNDINIIPMSHEFDTSWRSYECRYAYRSDISNAFAATECDMQTLSASSLSFGVESS